MTMADPKISEPGYLQLQSPLLCLPAEIKHIIYGYIFVADGLIVDPIREPHQPTDECVPGFGVNLLLTCRRMYHETDRRPLFTRNRFSFTHIDRLRCFLDFLDREQRVLVRDIEIDCRRVHADHPGIAREWLQCLARGCGPWTRELYSLRKTTPGLKCLRLNVETWSTISIFADDLWNLLGCMLLQVSGLERIVVTGTNTSARMAKLEPWSPVHFVGSEHVGSDDLVQRMWNAVQSVDETDKVIRWRRENGRVELEVVTKAYLVTEVETSWAGTCQRSSHTDPWPQNGSCSWLAYQHRDTEFGE